jgi:hypothetical protein
MTNLCLCLTNDTTFSKSDRMKSANVRAMTYDKQDVEPGSQIVRIWGDTPVVTAKLSLRGKATGVRLQTLVQRYLRTDA